MKRPRLPPALRDAVAADPTLALKLAAEACLSHRSVTRCLAGDGVRSNTLIAIVRAWERLQGPRPSRLESVGVAAPRESQLEDTRPPSRLTDAPKRKKRPTPKKRSKLRGA